MTVIRFLFIDLFLLNTTFMKPLANIVPIVGSVCNVYMCLSGKLLRLSNVGLYGLMYLGMNHVKFVKDRL